MSEVEDRGMEVYDRFSNNGCGHALFLDLQGVKGHIGEVCAPGLWVSFS